MNRTTFLKLLDASAGNALCKLMGMWRHVRGLPELARSPDPASVRHILIIRPGGMGDMIMLLPVLEAVRRNRPDITIDIVCEQRNAEVLSLANLGLRVCLYDTAPVATLRHLRSTSYDAVLDSEQFHNFSAVMAALSGAPVRAGFRINPSRLHLYTHLVSYDVDGYELDQFSRLLPAAGLGMEISPVHGILSHLAGDLAADLDPRVEALPPDIPLVAVSPGSLHPHKQWPADRWRELTHRLLADGIGIVLVGGRDQETAVSALGLQESAANLVNCVGRQTLRQTASVLQRVKAVVSGDSGLAHLATALGCSTVVLFGPSDPRKWNHPGSAHTAVTVGLPCSPCSIFGYRKLCRTIPCMKTLSVDEVEQGVINTLSRP